MGEAADYTPFAPPTLGRAAPRIAHTDDPTTPSIKKWTVVPKIIEHLACLV